MPQFLKTDMWQRPLRTGPAFLIAAFIALGAIIGVGTVAYVAHGIIISQQHRAAARDKQFCDLAAANRADEPYIPPAARAPTNKVVKDANEDPDCHVKAAATGTGHVPPGPSQVTPSIKPGPTKSVFVPYYITPTSTPIRTPHKRHHHKPPVKLPRPPTPTPRPSTCIMSVKLCVPPLKSFVSAVPTPRRSSGAGLKESQ